MSFSILDIRFQRSWPRCWSLGTEYQQVEDKTLSSKWRDSVLKKLSEVKVNAQYQVKISNRFAALENLHGRRGINRAGKFTVEDIKIPAQDALIAFKFLN
jgi:hypothetical protein